MARDVRYIAIEPLSLTNLGTEHVVEWKEKYGERRFLMNFSEELHDYLRCLVILKQIYKEGVAEMALLEDLRVHASRTLEKIRIPRYETTYIMECHWRTPEGPFVEVHHCNVSIILGICANATFEIEEQLLDEVVKLCADALQMLDVKKQKPGFTTDAGTEHLMSMDDDELGKA